MHTGRKSLLFSERESAFTTYATSKAELLNPQRPNNHVKWVGVALIVAGGAVVFFGIIACLGSNEIIAVGALASIGTGGSCGIIGGGVFLIGTGILLTMRLCCNQCKHQRRVRHEEKNQQKKESEIRHSEYHVSNSQASRKNRESGSKREKNKKNQRESAFTPKNTPGKSHEERLSSKRAGETSSTSAPQPKQLKQKTASNPAAKPAPTEPKPKPREEIAPPKKIEPIISSPSTEPIRPPAQALVTKPAPKLVSTEPKPPSKAAQQKAPLSQRVKQMDPILTLKENEVPRYSFSFPNKHREREIHVELVGDISASKDFIENFKSELISTFDEPLITYNSRVETAFKNTICTHKLDSTLLLVINRRLYLLIPDTEVAIHASNNACKVFNESPYSKNGCCTQILFEALDEGCIFLGPKNHLRMDSVQEAMKRAFLENGEKSQEEIYAASKEILNASYQEPFDFSAIKIGSLNLNIRPRLVYNPIYASGKKSVAQKMSDQLLACEKQQQKEDDKGFNLSVNFDKIPEKFHPETFASESCKEKFKAGVAHCQGYRMEMEDESFICTINLPSQSGQPHRAFFWGMCDGHGGDLAAKWVSRNIAPRLSEILIQHQTECLTDEQITNAISEVCMKLDSEIDAEYTELKLRKRPGTTLTGNFLYNGRLYTFNAGDARTIYVAEGETKQLSRDHKPRNFHDRQILEDRGGFVTLGYAGGMLAVTRDIGYVKASCGITAKPEITCIEAKEGIAICACDGVWDVASSNEVGVIVEIWQKEGATPEEIAKRLVIGAINNQSADNVTALVVFLDRELIEASKPLLSTSVDVTDYPMNEPIIDRFFDQFSEWEKQKITYDKLSAEIAENYSLMSDLNSCCTSIKNQAQETLTSFLELYELFIAFRDEKGRITDSIDLNEMAAALKVKPGKLRQLFERFQLPEISWTDIGCLNVFFATLPNIWGPYGLGFSSTQINLTSLFQNGHPLWPESKIPSKTPLTPSEFAQFLHASIEDCQAAARQAGLELNEDGISTRTMGEFCTKYTIGGNQKKFAPKQNIPLIWLLTSGDYTTPWTRSKQLRCQLPSWVSSAKKG